MQKIAIVGLSCLFPGANTPEQYWQNLISAKDSVSLATDAQTGVEAEIFYDSSAGAADKYYCLKGGYIRNFKFDAVGYSISSELLQGLDSLHQWSLYVAKQALQDSGYFGDASVLSRCGVILGNLSFPTQASQRLLAPIYQQVVSTSIQELLQNQAFQLPNLPTNPDLSPLNGLLSGYVSALVAQALSLSGPYLCLDAACASSLHAIELASRYLLSGKADLMLAGAVSCAETLFINLGFSIFQAYPKEGDCRPLDRSTKGLIVGDGAGIVALKRYDDAIRDGDRIYSIIRGVGLSNDGRGKSVLSPNPKGQLLAFQRAYANAGISPDIIEYLECHATGTPLGDRTELQSIHTFFGQNNSIPKLGSVKSNFGHLLTTAGMASLIKVILSMEKGIIPPTINLTNPLDPNVVSVPTPWTNHTDSKRAAVNAFGFGGTNAHLILESAEEERQSASVDWRRREEQAEIQNSRFESQNRLAIIGMAAHFGSCDDLDAFDRSIYQGVQHFIPVPPERWHGLDTQSQLLQEYGFAQGKAPLGAYIQDFEIDCLYFKIQPHQDAQLIPQQQLLLKIADRAIKDAGLKQGQNVAVLVAMGTELTLHKIRGRCDLTWQIKSGLAQANLHLPPEKVAELEALTKDSLHPRAQVNQYTSVIGNVMACRVSALWDFSGPAFTISSEENSVFKALEVAQLLLNDSDVDAVVVGAVNLSGSFEHVLYLQQMAAINTGTPTLSFNSNTNGWLVGEGAGAIVLKRHETAQQSQDRIYAVIDAMSLVQDNRSPESLDRLPKYPTAESVRKACEQVFELAAIQPSEIGYLEVFGSGIPQQDESEIHGLLSAYQSANGELSCCLGSVKANIGHTFAASGMTSLIKTALCLYHRYIPATPQWSRPKSLASWQNSPFYVETESRTWFLEPTASKRIAAINGLGLDGSCAHLILSEELSRKDCSYSYLRQLPFYLFLVTADDQSTLLVKLHQLQTTIKGCDNLTTAAGENFLTFQNRSQTYTLALLGHNRVELLEEIRDAVDSLPQVFQSSSEWKTPLGSYFTVNPLGKIGKVAFVYPGMASSDVNVGRDLFRLFPHLFESIASVTPNAGQVIHEKLLYPRSRVKPSQTEQKKQRADFFDSGVAMVQSGSSFAVLYTQVLKDHFSIQPQAAFGYSLGEASAMLFSLGVWRDGGDNTGNAMLTSSPLFRTQLCGSCLAVHDFWKIPYLSEHQSKKVWESFLLKAPVSAVKEILRHEKRVYLTFINTPEEVIIAGDPEDCLRLIAAFEYQHFPVPLNSVVHCEVVRSVYDELVDLHTQPLEYVPENITFYSVVDCAPLSLNTQAIAQNSSQLLCQTINFPALVDRVYSDDVRIFIETGVGSHCSRWIEQTLQGQNHIAVPAHAKRGNSHTQILRALARLASHGVAMDLSPLYTLTIPSKVDQESVTIKVTLGGHPIDAKILTEVNRRSFGNYTALPLYTNGEALTIAAYRPTALTSENNLTVQKINSQFCSTMLQQLPNLYPQDSGGSTKNDLAQRLKIAQLQLANSCSRSKLPLSNQSYSAQPNSHNTRRSKADGTVIWDEADLLEFAEGKISRIFGSDFEVIDSYTRRVRLPMPPYLLVSRVTKLEAEVGRYKPSKITTEYDIPLNAWYCVDGQIPWAIAVESGQCDLLLISYIGIDFENKGNLVYRLLDCTITFLDEVPKAGDTLRYDIEITSFVKHGDNLLFFFRYECFIGEKKMIKMDGGCAGFFSNDQLEKGKGVVLTAQEVAEKQQMQKRYFEPLLICQKLAFDEADLLSLAQGNIAACFGESYWQAGLNPSLRLPPKAMLMFDRVVSVDHTGGAWGLGLIVAEKHLDPEHWYFPCHFKDDQVLAGSLMAEGCGQLLLFYLLYLGLQTCTVDARYQPIPYLRQVVRCRGQVTPKDRKLTYRLEVSDIGLNPKPYAKGNVEILLNDKIVVHFKDVGLQLWEKDLGKTIATQNFANLEPRPLKISKQSVLINETQVEEFCTGQVSQCFGSEYEVYDTGHLKVSRIPNTHLRMVDRILEVHGKRHQLTKYSTIIAEYDASANPWYYRQNSYPTPPYAILMEIGLQPCGFLSAYLGSTFLCPNSHLFFRNLDGRGYLVKEIDIRSKTLTTTARLLSSTKIQGMILQRFDFQVACETSIFYEGEASFGHFSDRALAEQVGLDMGRDVRPWYETENIMELPEINFDLKSQEGRTELYAIHPSRPHYHLASYQLDLLHHIKIIVGGGQFQKGYIYARKEVKPSDWYFKCHFYRDPVMPGSLGVEAMMQALQAYALHLDLGKLFRSPRFKVLDNHQIVWKYRGQIPHGYVAMDLEIHITKIDITPNQVTLVADASLWKPNMRIYEVKQLAICLVESESFL